MARYLAHHCPKCAGDLWIDLLHCLGTSFFQGDTLMQTEHIKTTWAMPILLYSKIGNHGLERT